MSRPLRRNPDFIHRSVGDEEILVPVRRVGADLSSLYLLNPVAATLWEELAEPRTPVELLATLLTRFDVEPEIAEADLRLFLEELEAVGAITEEPV